MDSNLKPKSFKITSFKHATSGILAAFKLEPNIKIHILAGAVVIILGLILNLNSSDWVKVIILIGFVISVELTNASIEQVVDSFTSAEHPGAKLAKDISAGAVLVAALTAAVSGAIIFFPYILNYV